MMNPKCESLLVEATKSQNDMFSLLDLSSWYLPGTSNLKIQFCYLFLKILPSLGLVLYFILFFIK